MADDAGLIERAFRMPEEARLGIELSLDLDRHAPSLGHVMLVLQSLATVRAYILTTATLLDWIDGKGPLSARTAAVAQEYLNFLEAQSNEAPLMLSSDFTLEASRRLDLLSSAIGRNPLFPWADADLPVEFVGAFRENPTKFRFVMYLVGGFLGGVAVSTFGAVQVMKELDAPACRERYGEILRHQTDAILRQAKLEGRMTSVHGHALETATKAAQASAAACGSLLSHMGLKIKVDPDKSFEVSMEIGGARYRTGD